MRSDETETDLWTIAGVWEGRRILEVRLEAKPSTLVLKVRETPEL